MRLSVHMQLCTRHVDSTNSGRSNLAFRSDRQTIPEAEISNRLIDTGSPRHSAT